MDTEEVIGERFDTLARVFAKADRVLSGMDVQVQVVNTKATRAPAWTDGQSIVFNRSVVQSPDTTEGIVTLTGLNFHELAHVLYTPRTASKLHDTVRKKRLTTAFNILEDQRIETLLTAVYPSTKPYFLATFMDFCVRENTEWHRMHLLSWGRHYIPSELRKEFRNRYQYQHHISKINNIIDEYRFLALDNGLLNYKKALELIVAFDGILDPMVVVKDPNGHDMAVHGGVNKSPVSVGSPLPNQRQRVDVKRAEKEEAAASAETTQPESSACSDGEVGSNNRARSGADQALQEALEDVVRSVMNDPGVMRDVSGVRDAVVGGDDDHRSTVRRATSTPMLLAPTDVVVARRFARELEQLRSECDPGWRRYEASGRVNVQRAMHTIDLDTVFDSWSEGRDDATDIEAVVLLDMSSSMDYLMTDASRAMWIVKRAFEAIGASATVLGFDTDAYLLYDRKDVVARDRCQRWRSCGGTDPCKALREARKVFAASRRRRHILLAVTDGEWASPQRAESIIADLNQHGVITAMAYLSGVQGNGGLEAHRHGCQTVHHVRKPLDLVGLARSITRDAIRQNTHSGPGRWR